MLLYEVYLPSFTTTGKRHLKNITSRVSYFKQLKVDAIWLTPFYPSPLVDNGYDVSNYTEVDSRYGSLDDFKILVKTFNEAGIKVVIDLVFNHSSNKHEWFKKSEANDKKYSEYYIWSKKPLNTWESFFGGDSWSYSEGRKEYYLHRFAKEQPDLNLTNTSVLKELEDILVFWSNLEVDGFRLDVVNFYLTDRSKLTDNRPESRINHQQTFELLNNLQKKLKIKTQKEHLFIGEVGSEDLEVLAKYNTTLDSVFAFNISAIKTYDLKKIVAEIAKTYKYLENPSIPFSSHDMKRFFYRLCNYDEQKAKVILSLLLALPGIKVLYQGDEYGQRDFIPSSIDDINDIQGINHYRKKLKEGRTREEAERVALEETRDYSRNILTFDEKSPIFKHFIHANTTLKDNISDSFSTLNRISLEENQIIIKRQSEDNNIKVIKIDINDGRVEV